MTEVWKSSGYVKTCTVLGEEGARLALRSVYRSSPLGVGDRTCPLWHALSATCLICLAQALMRVRDANIACRSTTKLPIVIVYSWPGPGFPLGRCKLTFDIRGERIPS